MIINMKMFGLITPFGNLSSSIPGIVFDMPQNYG